MYHYEGGSVRWLKSNGKGDVRGYRCPRGWRATADLIEHHPITGEFLGKSQWWIRETREV